MKFKGRFLICIAVFIILVAAGCTSYADSPPPTEIEPVDPSPILKPTSMHYEPSRTEAVPFGATASVGIVDFTIADLVRPATERVLAASSANPKPSKGMEYVLVDLIEVCAAETYQECFIKVHNMRLIGSTGIERRPQNLNDVPLMFPNRHING